MEKQKRIITQEEWDSKLDQIKIPRAQMNRLVMDYLITEGYQEAADNFQIESGISILTEDYFAERDSIRKALMSGDIDKAVLLANSISPTILESQPKLMFELRVQKLINYIRENKISEALAYGQEVLAPAAQGNSELLTELEKAMSLIAFNDILQSPLADICSPMHKLRLASEVNGAVIQFYQNIKRTSKLTDVCKILAWSQRNLEKKFVLPDMQISPK